MREDGAEYYAEAADTDRRRANPFVREHVPHLTGPVKPRRVIAQEIRGFAGERPEWWADYAAYDWVVLCQLYGPMASLPEGWPWYCRDLRQWVDDLGLTSEDLPRSADPEHHALADARELHDRWHFLAARHPAALVLQRDFVISPVRVARGRQSAAGDAISARSDCTGRAAAGRPSAGIWPWSWHLLPLTLHS